MTSTLKWAKICPPWRGSLHRCKVKVMETFPTEESCIRILYSLLRLQNENWEGKLIASF